MTNAWLESIRKANTETLWRDDPVRFAREALGVELWGRQAEVARAVARNDSVAVRSGHKVGKSILAAVLALWWAVTRKEGKVVLTSASGRQVRSILWKEIKRLVRRAKIQLPKPAELPDLGMQWEDGREIVGFSTDDAERMAGISGAEVLFILDEASGIAEQIFEAIEGNRAAGARLVMFSNPTQTSGTFFDAFHTKREFWCTFHISSVEAAAVTPHVPGLALPSYIDKKLREWGEDSPLYQVRVLGNFAVQGKNAVIGLGLVEAARLRWDDTPETGRLEIGVDVARFGDDDSVIYPRRGNRLLEATAVHGMDTVAVAAEVLRVVRELRRPDDTDLPLVKVDTIGVGGGVADILEQHGSELEAVHVNTSEASSTPDKYPNLRSEIHFAIALWLRDGGAIPDDPLLEGELVAPTYSFDLKGRQKVESKDEIKKRLKRSPDRSDAMGLSIHASYVSGPNQTYAFRPRRWR